MRDELNTTATYDRGNKTIEQLEAEMGPAAKAMVDSMASKIIKKNKREGRKFYSRNRNAWDRMNRKAKETKIDLGFQRLYNLIGMKGFLTDAEIAAGGKALLNARDTV